MKNSIKYGLIAGILTSAIGAQGATFCTTDAECLSKGLSALRKAAKYGCDSSALATRLKTPVSSADQIAGMIDSIELCVEKGKYQARINKKADKRLERIKKALEKK